MIDAREQFGKRLEKILDEQNMTSRRAAEDIGCTGATIGRWKRGEVPYSVVVILAGLHRKYGIDLNELICGDSE